MLCANFVEIGPMFLGRRCFNFVNVFSLFHNYLPLEKFGALHLNKLESHSPMDVLCQVWLKLAQWFSSGPVVQQKRIFFNFINVFSLFRNNLPLEKSDALQLDKFESCLPKNAMCKVWLKLVQCFGGEDF